MRDLCSNNARKADGFTVFRSYSHHIAGDLRKRRHSASAAPTLSAICPCTRASRRPITRTPTDTVRRTN